MDPTSLALDMLDQSAQELEFGGALRALVHLMFMHRAFQMLVQGLQGSELPRAEVAFIGVAVPCSACGPGVNSPFCVGILKEAVRDEIVSIIRTDHVVDFLTSGA